MNRTLSSVHRGTAFEQISLNLLQAHFSMSLRRVGGKSDGGIDLLGWWWLPFAAATTHANATTDYPGALVDPEGIPRRRLRVLAQCKAERKKFSPRYVREMEGVWHLHSKSSSSMSSISMDTLASDSHSSPLSSSSSSSTFGNAYPTVALLLSESAFSESTFLHAYRSTVPFLLIHIPSVSHIPSEDGVSPTANVNTNAGAVQCTTESPLGPAELGSVCPNPTLSQLVHPLSFRWEHNPTFVPRGTMRNSSTTEIASWVRGRPGLWWDGRKLGSWVPDDQVIPKKVTSSD